MRRGPEVGLGSETWVSNFKVSVLKLPKLPIPSWQVPHVCAVRAHRKPVDLLPALPAGHGRNRIGAACTGTRIEPADRVVGDVREPDASARVGRQVMVCIKGEVVQPNRVSVCGGERPELPALSLGIQTRDMAWKERSDPQPITPAHQRVWTQKVGSGNRQRANRTARRVDSERHDWSSRPPQTVCSRHRGLPPRG